MSEHEGCHCCNHEPKSDADILVSQAENQFSLARFWHGRGRNDLCTLFLDQTGRLLNEAGVKNETSAWLETMRGSLVIEADAAAGLKHFEEAHAIAQTCLPEKHPARAIVTCNLGETYVDIGRTEEGLVLLEAGLTVLRNPEAVAGQYTAEYLEQAAAGFASVVEKARTSTSTSTCTCTCK